MLSHFVVKFESFDVDGFTKAVRQYDVNGIILIWNYVGEIKVVQCPEHIRLRASYSYFRPGTWSDKRWYKWPALIVTMGRILTHVLIQDRIKHYHVGGGDVLLWMGQLAKFLGRIEKTSTTMEDWSAPRKYANFPSWLNDLKARLNDWLLIHMDTTVIVTPREIFEARNAYWQNRTLRNSILHDSAWAWFLDCKVKGPVETKTAKNIALLGTLRREFGLELMFSQLAELNAKYGMRLKIIGPEGPLSSEYRELARTMAVDEFVDWCGFVPTERLPQVLADCFCGINIQEHEDNYSRYVIAGRVVHYIQHLVVPVVSVYSGALVRTIASEELGLICQPTPQALKDAILDAFHNQSSFRARTLRFINHNPYRLQAGKIFGL